MRDASCNARANSAGDLLRQLQHEGEREPLVGSAIADRGEHASGSPGVRDQSRQARR